RGVSMGIDQVLLTGGMAGTKQKPADHRSSGPCYIPVTKDPASLDAHEADLLGDLLTVGAEGELEKLGRFARGLVVRVIERRTGERVAFVEHGLFAGDA